MADLIAPRPFFEFKARSGNVHVADELGFVRDVPQPDLEEMMFHGFMSYTPDAPTPEAAEAAAEEALAPADATEAVEVPPEDVPPPPEEPAPDPVYEPPPPDIPEPVPEESAPHRRSRSR
jgi:hypothetical protein